LRLEVTLDRLRRISGRGHGVATVDGALVAEGDMLFVMGTAGDST
jgi:3-hydroxymyristoyl/3-hydroxydecanoyl-(acyl carrier protein) dehydratase